MGKTSEQIQQTIDGVCSEIRDAANAVRKHVDHLDVMTGPEGNEERIPDELRNIRLTVGEIEDALLHVSRLQVDVRELGMARQVAPEPAAPPAGGRYVPSVPLAIAGFDRVLQPGEDDDVVVWCNEVRAALETVFEASVALAAAVGGEVPPLARWAGDTATESQRAYVFGVKSLLGLRAHGLAARQARRAAELGGSK